jgi:hypothetical protein
MRRLRIRWAGRSDDPAARVARPRRRAWLAVGCAVLLAACGAPPPRHATAEAFRDTRVLESRLQPGVSSMEEVRQLLGEPTGAGAVLLPGLPEAPQQIWFYQDIELTDMKAVQDRLDLQVRQQVLIVFVRDQRFDGFMWFSNAEAATGWIKDSLRARGRR